MGRYFSGLAPVAAIGIACLVLFATAPVAGDFWWSDAPRHALNGVFVKDLVAAAPLHDPARWAANYYLKYPALTILFYPPFFYGVEAVFYTLFGVSHATAQATVTVFSFFLGLGGYLVARNWLARTEATCAALLIVGCPEMAFWGRQVMLDVPACTGLAFCLLFFIRYLRGARPLDIVLSALFFLVAVYTKFNAVFAAPVFVAALVGAQGIKALHRSHLLIAAAATAVLLLPAVYLTIHFGTANIDSVAGRSIDMPRWSLAAWLYYPSLLPSLVGWPTLVLGLGGIAAALTLRGSTLRGWPLWLLLGWIIFGDLFFSAIGVREPRHILMVLLPLPILAISALAATLPVALSRTAAALLAAGTLVYSVWFDQPPKVSGYQEVADYVTATAPANARVLFSGYRDGNFVFDIRAEKDRHDISVIRADKLFLKVAVERERGVGQTAYSADEMLGRLKDLGIDLVVAQDGFWEDLDQMATLSGLLKSDAFEEIAQFPVTGTPRRGEQTITLYRPRYPVESHTVDLTIDMPIFRDRLSGSLGQ